MLLDKEAFNSCVSQTVPFFMKISEISQKSANVKKITAIVIMSLYVSPAMADEQNILSNPSSINQREGYRYL
ncbi:TPA: hypothetical protein ACLGW6_005201, partial [Salmonella enterica]